MTHQRPSGSFSLNLLFDRSGKEKTSRVMKWCTKAVELLLNHRAILISPTEAVSFILVLKTTSRASSQNNISLPSVVTEAKTKQLIKPQPWDRGTSPTRIALASFHGGNELPFKELYNPKASYAVLFFCSL